MNDTGIEVDESRTESKFVLLRMALVDYRHHVAGKCGYQGRDSLWVANELLAWPTIVEPDAVRSANSCAATSMSSASAVTSRPPAAR
jgi:hypothetical protein